VAFEFLMEPHRSGAIFVQAPPGARKANVDASFFACVHKHACLQALVQVS
jgi:hypothetical protein